MTDDEPGRSTAAMLRRIAPVVVLGVIGGFLVAELIIGFATPTSPLSLGVGSDYRLYMDATARWLAGGPFYPASQLAGAYSAAIRPILYPPQMLGLFAPFSVLPAILWFGIPIALTGWIVAWHRPNRWGWIAIGAMIAALPMLFLPYVSGTPTTWIAAFLALGTRWPAASALILLKPTLAPFALVGIRSRGWWVIAVLLALAGLALWPMTLDWIRSLAGLTGDKSGVFYSADNVPLMLVPLIAWLTGRHAPEWLTTRLPRPAIA